MSKAVAIAAALLIIALVVVLRRGERPAPVSVGAASEGAAGLEPAPAPLTASEAPKAPAGTRTDVWEPASADQPEEGGHGVADMSAASEDDPVGCIMYGRITDAAGGSIEVDGGRQVGFEDVSGESIWSAVGEDGAYSVAGLVPGRWIVSCSVDGYRPHWRPFELLPGSRAVRHDVALEPAVAGVRVMLLAPDGRPFFEALRESGSHLMPGMIPAALATAEPPGATFDESKHSHVGRFQKDESGSQPPGCLGTIVLDGDPPAWVSLVLEPAVLATERLEPGDDEVVFTLTPERLLTARSALRLRAVEAESGAPIEGAEVILMGNAFANPTPRTDAEGVAAIENLAPGRREFWLLAPGREDARRTLTLPAGETLDLGTLELAPGMVISGRLIDRLGAPVAAGLELGVLDPATRELAMVKSQRWMSGRNGAFAIHGLARGQYVVRTDRSLSGDDAKGIGATSNHVVSTLAGSVEDLELVLVPTGRMLLRVGRPDWRSLRYRALDEQGLERAGGRIWDELQFAVDLPHGRYRILVTDAAGAVVLEQTIIVGEKTVAVDLPPG